MGKYACPECSGITGVVETRPANGRLKRRRACVECKRRFTTIEVPHSAPKEMLGLLSWLGISGEMLDYAKHKVSHILLGTPLDDDEDDCS